MSDIRFGMPIWRDRLPPPGASTRSAVSICRCAACLLSQEPRLRVFLYSLNPWQRTQWSLLKLWPYSVRTCQRTISQELKNRCNFLLRRLRRESGVEIGRPKHSNYLRLESRRRWMEKEGHSTSTDATNRTAIAIAIFGTSLAPITKPATLRTTYPRLAET